jgi:hypothetical protein
MLRASDSPDGGSTLLRAADGNTDDASQEILLRASAEDQEM